VCVGGSGGLARCVCAIGLRLRLRLRLLGSSLWGSSLTPAYRCCRNAYSNDRLVFDCLRYLFALTELHPHVGGYIATLRPDVVVRRRPRCLERCAVLTLSIVWRGVVFRKRIATTPAGCIGTCSASLRSPW
jgi:hypothetical protein